MKSFYLSLPNSEINSICYHTYSPRKFCVLKRKTETTETETATQIETFLLTQGSKT